MIVGVGLLMVIPLSVGYLFAREAEQEFPYRGWRHRLASLDGKTLLMWFGVLVMILALIFSASRMGIACLLLAFGVITLLFRDPQGERWFSRPLMFISALAEVTGASARVAPPRTNASKMTSFLIWASPSLIRRPHLGSGPMMLGAWPPTKSPVLNYRIKVSSARRAPLPIEALDLNSTRRRT